MSSIRVKPRAAWTGDLLPAADVGIVTFAAGLAVGAKGQHIHLALDARVHVLIRTPPGVVGQLVQISFPVGWHRLAGWSCHQRLQALLGRGVTQVVELVELERLHQIAYIGAGGGYAGVVRTADHVGYDQGCQHTDDGQHYHQLDQGEAVLTAAAVAVQSVHVVDHNLRMLQNRSASSPVHWLPSGSAALLWGLSAASAVLWWLHLPNADGPETPVASLPQSEQITQGRGSVGRALGHTGTAVADADERKRFRLVGVIASTDGHGSALIAVDGQAPKPYLIGHELEGGWFLNALTAYGATLQSNDRSLDLHISVNKGD